MAHQAHNIPWTVLASNLKWRLSNPCKLDATDFHWGQNPDRAKELSYFAEAFARTVNEHADGERRKFPAEYEQPKPEDVVLSDKLCQKIIPTVHRWRLKTHRLRYSYQHPRTGICPHTESREMCTCTLPHKERIMEAFMRARQPNDCYTFHEENKEEFFNLEIFKTLLLHGEMDTLLKIYSGSSTNLRDWWGAQPCQCEGPILGWEFVAKYALKTYILLNTISIFPETWILGRDRQKDYRNTRAYQHTIRTVTLSEGNSEVAKFPHRQFFGITDEQFREYWEAEKENKRQLKKHYKNSYPYGRIPIEAFLTLEKDVGHLRLASEEEEVRYILYGKGLPAEIVDEIWQATDYQQGIRQLPVEHDPFHPENHAELQKYLKYCWTLLVRCELIARAINLDIGWKKQLVSEALVELFGDNCNCNAKGKVCDRDYEPYYPYSAITFV